MTNRLPEDYKLKESNGWNYFKVTEESQSFRILTSPIIWREYFKEESDWKVKPVRQKAEFNGIPADSKEWNKPKEFWAFVIRNHNLKKVQIMEITQQSIKKELIKYAKDSDWGDPKTYDITIYKTGKGKETRYSLTASPKSKFADVDEENAAIEEAKKVALDAIWTGDDPFALPF